MCDSVPSAAETVRHAKRKKVEEEPIGAVATKSLPEEPAQSEATMTEQTADRIAAEEGLTLVRCNRVRSGFRHVKISGARGESKPFQLVYVGKARGRYASAAEAALAFARLVGPAESARAAEEAAREPMSWEEVQQAADTEGLTLVPSNCESGFANVQRKRPRASKAGGATHTVRAAGFLARSSTCHHIGTAATAAEAALLYARHIGRQASAEAAALEKRRSTERMTPEEAEAQAAAEGLTLVRSSHNRLGFAGLSYVAGGHGKIAVICRGKHVTGRCATPEEGALMYARALGAAESKKEADTEHAKVVPVSEVEQLATAEGLTLLRSSQSQSGFKYIYKIYKHNNNSSFQAIYKSKYLGSAKTPVEAALLLARKLGPEKLVAEQQAEEEEEQRRKAKLERDAVKLRAQAEQAGANARAKAEREATKARAKAEREAAKVIAQAQLRAQQEEAKSRAKAEREETKARAKAEREAAREAAKGRQRAELEELKRQQVAQEEHKAQQQRKLPQEAAERQRQRAAASTAAGSIESEASGGAAEVSNQTTDDLIEQVRLSMWLGLRSGRLKHLVREL